MSLLELLITNSFMTALSISSVKYYYSFIAYDPIGERKGKNKTAR